MIPVFDLARHDTNLERVCQAEYAGKCPGCGGKDRFHIKLTKHTGKGGFMCRSCWPAEEKGWGDSVDYLRHFKGMSYQAALQELGTDTQSTYSPAPHQYMSAATPPSTAWQDRGSSIATLAEKCLWSKKGRVALDYLHRRGFTDETIHQAHLGYIPQDYYDALAKWGLVRENLTSISTKVFLPRGILIPWWAEGHLWKITVRRPVRPGDHRRYMEVLGSRECLFNADTISSKKTAVLYEGIFDALSGMQEAPMLAHVATDDTHKCRHARWIAKLAMPPALLIAYDADAAGDKGAAFWQKTFPEAIRWQPWAKDTNEMLVQGLGIGKWLELGIATSLRSTAVQALPCAEAGPLQERVWELAERLGFPALCEIEQGDTSWIEHLAYSDTHECHILENALNSLGAYLQR